MHAYTLISRDSIKQSYDIQIFETPFVFRVRVRVRVLSLQFINCIKFTRRAKELPVEYIFISKFKREKYKKKL